MDWFSSKTPLIVGHRGASAYAPENTLAAFEQAADLGADGIEFDVQLSADGAAVVIHDQTVDRTTSGTGTVAKLTLAELRRFDAGEGQTIPTLDEVFEMLGSRLLYNVEIKDFVWRERGIEAVVADRIQAHHLESRVIVSSFNPFAVRRARRYLTKTTPVALLRAPGWMKYAYLLASGQADHPHHSMIDDRYMAWARGRGYRVNTWTVDDADTARRLARLGVDAIITNKPDVIRQSLS